MRRLLLELTPVCDRFWSISVDLQPGDGFRKCRSMEQSALDANRSIQVEQPVLQRDDLVQPFDVAPGNGQQSEFDAAFERIGGKPLPPADEADREEERPGKDGIAQRVRRIMKASAVAVERSNGAAEGFLIRYEFRRDGLEQPGGSQLIECGFGVAGAKDLVVLLDEPRGRA